MKPRPLYLDLDGETSPQSTGIFVVVVLLWVLLLLLCWCWHNISGGSGCGWWTLNTSKLKYCRCSLWRPGLIMDFFSVLCSHDVRARQHQHHTAVSGCSETAIDELLKWRGSYAMGTEFWCFKFWIQDTGCSLNIFIWLLVSTSKVALRIFL